MLQAMCEFNKTVTPRPPSPRSQPKRKTRNLEPTRLTSEFPNLATRKPPTSHHGYIDSDEDDTRPLPRPRRTGSTGLTHQVQKPKPSVVRNGSSSTNSRQTVNKNSTPTSPSQETRARLRKYGVETTDRGDYFTRQGTQSRQNSDLSTDSWLQASSRKASNSDRTRSTLDNLLGDSDDTATHDLLAHIGNDRRKDVNKTRQNVAVKKSTPKGNRPIPLLV